MKPCPYRHKNMLFLKWNIQRIKHKKIFWILKIQFFFKTLEELEENTEKIYKKVGKKMENRDNKK